MDAARAAQLLQANEQLVLAVIRAQDEAAAAAQALRDLARSPHIEALTEQPDGALLFDRMSHALAVARRKLSKVGLLFVSVDNLEDINNTLGHARGEQVLKLAAQRLASAVRGSDTVSRQGSHEFLILLTDLSHARDALTIADSIVAAMRLPGQVGGQKVSLRASIGISVFPDDGNDGDALIDRATAAMYSARRHGVGSYFFRDEPATKERSLALRTAEWLRRLSGSVAPYGDPGTAEPRREANEQLLLAALRSQQLQDAAELAYRRQIELMGVVAHELRQPLGPITMAASMLSTENVAEPSVMPMVKGVIERQVALMTRLVGDLLDMTRISTGKLRLDIHRMDMARVVGEVVSDLRPAVAARLQQLRVELPPGELTVNGDRLRLGQVMSNLISNACKYTQHGGSIEISAAATEGTLAISVTDNGIGISAKALPHIFDPFMQEHRAASFDGSGLGIGLSLVRELVQAHGGQVTAESKGLGQGSRFTLTLPLLRVA